MLRPEFLLVLIAFLFLGCSLATRRQSVSPEQSAPASHWIRQGTQAESAGKLDDAKRFFRYALSVDKDSLEAAARLAEVLRKNDEFQTAEKLYKWILKQKTSFDTARIGLAWLYFEQGNLARVRPLVVKTASDFADAHLAGALAQIDGKAATSEALLRKARKMAQRPHAAVDADAIADLDCRLTSNRNDSQMCPYGPISTGTSSD